MNFLDNDIVLDRHSGKYGTTVIKGKHALALSLGLPVVGTALGAAGMYGMSKLGLLGYKGDQADENTHNEMTKIGATSGLVGSGVGVAGTIGAGYLGQKIADKKGWLPSIMNIKGSLNGSNKTLLLKTGLGAGVLGAGLLAALPATKHYFNVRDAETQKQQNASSAFSYMSNSLY